MTVRILGGDAVAQMRTLGDASVDAIVTDPPYPEISRQYGRLSEDEWHALMRAVVAEARRVLKPRGSVVFILQANQERVGRTRAWLWEFMAWIARDWNMVQDVWWWNHSAPPTVHCNRTYGLMRPSVKACVWAGDPDCYRRQENVLWGATESTLAIDSEDRSLRIYPSGGSMRTGRVGHTVAERGGVTPYNLIPIANSNSVDSGGALGHGAATPAKLIEWWIRYICPPGGVVLDPFLGSGTTALVADRLGRSCVGIELNPEYVEMARQRVLRDSPMFAEVTP